MEAVETALKRGNRLKDEGAALFSVGQHSGAVAKYLAAVSAATPHADGEAGEATTQPLRLSVSSISTDGSA